MARWHRSDEETTPYGPPPQPPVGDPAAPERPDGGEPPAATAPGLGAPPPPPPAGNQPPAYPTTPPPMYPGQPPAYPGTPPGYAGAPQPVAPWSPPPGAYSTVGAGAASLQYGRTLDRVMAYLLDGFIVAIPVLILSFILERGSLNGGPLRLGGATLVAGIVGLGIHLLYFVSFWTGSARATPGMRLMKLQIGDARTGATLTVQQGLGRWLALGGIFQFLDLVPPLLPLSAVLAFIWELVLLASTASSPTKQGFHDRMANTALVQPAGVQTPAVTCLVVVVALFAVWIVGIVALVFLGGQVSRILSTVGSSV